VVGRERALHLVDDQAWDAGQSLDEDGARADGADLFPQLGLAVEGDLSAEDDQVERSPGAASLSDRTTAEGKLALPE
jgi:hypothetical protein